MARRPSLSQHGSVEGVQEGGPTSGSLSQGLRPTKGMGHPSPPPSLATLRFGQASDGGSEGMAQPDPMIKFAELDAHNCPLRERLAIRVFLSRGFARPPVAARTAPPPQRRYGGAADAPGVEVESCSGLSE